MKVVLKNVNILNPHQNVNEKNVNILIEDGKFKNIGELTDAEMTDAKVFELDGKYIVPGFFDMHVHLREPGREDKETVSSGTKAAEPTGSRSVRP